MILRKMLVATALSAAVLFPLAAPASAQSALRNGATVSDPQGGAVGTVTSFDDEYIIVQTDRHPARLPRTSFTVTDDAILFGLTRDQLNSQIEQALAQAQQAISPGAIVHDRDGAVIGPVQTADADTITVQLGEQPVRLPRASVAPGPNGLVIGITLAELRAQIAAASTSGEGGPETGASPNASGQ